MKTTTKKMSFENIKDVLSREEMRMIMAGSGPDICTVRCRDSNNVELGTYITNWCGEPASVILAKCRSFWLATDTATCGCVPM